MTTIAAFPIIEHTLSVLLSPLEYPSMTAWRQAAHSALLELTEADSLCMYLPVGHPSDAWYAPHVSPERLSSYAAYSADNPGWDTIEAGFVNHIAKTGQRVVHESEFTTLRSRESTDFHHEFLSPYGLNDLTIADVALASGQSGRLHFANRHWRSRAENEQRQLLVRTVLPAFTSGAALWQQMARQHADLALLFDSLNDAVMLFDGESRLVHANRSATALLHTATQSSPEMAKRLTGEAAMVARRISALLQHAFVGGPTIAPSMASRSLQTATGRYSLRGALAPSWMFGRTHGVLVTLERSVERELSDAEIRNQFGLTVRELEVAKLVADGLTNQALAEHMGISFFTARNHVERVLNKLGANNRAHVGALLRTGGAQTTRAQTAAA